VSADQVAAAAVGAGTMLIMMGVLMVIALACVYQGAHAAHDGPGRDRHRAVEYHRLSPDERKIWRETGGHPIIPADVQAAADGSWKAKHRA